MQGCPQKLTLTYPLLREVVQHLQRSPSAFTPVGINRTRQGVEWLARGPVASEAAGPGVVWTREATLPLPLGGEPLLLVRLGGDSLSGWFLEEPWGLIRVPVRLLAPGLPEDPLPPWPPVPEERSRVAGALGEGWGRLPGLGVVVAGAGRLGSLASYLLLQAGIGRLVLVDPDRVEEGNLDGGLFFPGDLGRPKAEALRERLLEANPEARVEALPIPVQSLGALEAIKEADALVVATDWDRPRLALGALAATHLKPLLDLGVEARRDGRTGGEVRLLLPGEGCLLCTGGVAHPGEALLAERVRQSWREERRGSLPGLVAAVAGLGVELLLGFLTGRDALWGSRWLRLEWGSSGPRLEEPSWSPRGDCLCPWAGRGDEGLDQALAVGRAWMVRETGSEPGEDGAG